MVRDRDRPAARRRGERGRLHDRVEVVPDALLGGDRVAQRREPVGLRRDERDEREEHEHPDDDPRTAQAAAALEVDGLVKTYGARTAVDGLSLRARPGTVLALLGPNGAGKTSTVEVCEGFRRADGGAVRVLGLDPRREAPAPGATTRAGDVTTAPADEALETVA